MHLYCVMLHFTDALVRPDFPFLNEYVDHKNAAFKTECAIMSEEESSNITNMHFFFFNCF